MLGWEETFQAPPIVIQGDGKIVQSSNEAPAAAANTASASATNGGKGTPGIEAVAILAALGAALLVARRRQA
jgi:MYXO-CTERM domain-containing protein